MLPVSWRIPALRKYATCHTYFPAPNSAQPGLFLSDFRALIHYFLGDLYHFCRCIQFLAQLCYIATQDYLQWHDSKLSMPPMNKAFSRRRNFPQPSFRQRIGSIPPIKLCKFAHRLFYLHGLTLVHELWAIQREAFPPSPNYKKVQVSVKFIQRPTCRMTYASWAANFTAGAVVVVVALELRGSQTRRSEQSCKNYFVVKNHLDEGKMCRQYAALASVQMKTYNASSLWFWGKETPFCVSFIPAGSYPPRITLYSYFLKQYEWMRKYVDIVFLEWWGHLFGQSHERIVRYLFNFIAACTNFALFTQSLTKVIHCRRNLLSESVSWDARSRYNCFLDQNLYNCGPSLFTYMGLVYLLHKLWY